MVITVSCPSCSSSFPVDSKKIPEKGVNARCSTCGDIFRIEKPAETQPPPAPAQEVEPLPPPTPPAGTPPVGADSSGLDEVEVVPPPPLQAEVPPPAVPETPEPVPPPPPPEPEVTPEPEPATTPGPGEAGFRFGKRDPTDKAKRLARVLVSDMIMYNAERHATALEAGTLKEDFEEEIDKSWKEFVEQVGPEIANGPGLEFWREALNDILAKGEEIF